MPYDEPADLIASAEATIDTIALLLGDISEEVGDTPGAWSIAQILNHLLDTERRYFARVRRLRTESQPQMKVMPDADVTRLTALGLEALLQAQAAPHPASALAEAGRMEAVRHAEPDRQGHDRRHHPPHICA